MLLNMILFLSFKLQPSLGNFFKTASLEVNDSRNFGTINKDFI